MALDLGLPPKRNDTAVGMELLGKILEIEPGVKVVVVTGNDDRQSAVKAISWRIIATVTTMGIVYVYTGELALSLGVGVIEVFLKLFFYYSHERIWDKITWGEQCLDTEDGRQK